MTRTGEDDGLIRALREGSSVLSGDLHRLHAHLMLIHGLMAEKASEHEPAWDLAQAAAAEIETLQRLEAAVLERVASVEARTLLDLADKLAIWAVVDAAAAQFDETCPRAAIVRSVRRDLDALLRASAPGR